MTLFERKPIWVENPKGELIDIRECKDRSVKDLAFAKILLDKPIYTEESDHVRIIDNHTLYECLLDQRNTISVPLLEQRNEEYGRNYNESLFFFAQQIVIDFDHYNKTETVQTLYPYNQMSQYYINHYLIKDPKVIVNGVEFTTFHDIAQITKTITKDDDVRGNTDGLRAQIMYLPLDILFERTKNHAREALGYGNTKNIDLAYTLLEFIRRVEIGEIKEWRGSLGSSLSN